MSEKVTSEVLIGLPEWKHQFTHKCSKHVETIKENKSVNLTKWKPDKVNVSLRMVIFPAFLLRGRPT